MDKITYNLKLKDGKEYTFAVDIDSQDSQEGLSRETHSFWTELNYNQCSNCPLQASIHKHCPAALDLEETCTDWLGLILSSNFSFTVKANTVLTGT